MALSRARLGLYILGRRDVFESCYELQEAFNIIFKRPDKLVLVPGEMWPAQREILATGENTSEQIVEGETIMESVEHLGQYVYEITNAKVESLRSQRVAITMEAATTSEDVMMAGEEAYGEAYEDEDNIEVEGGDEEKDVEE